MFTGMSLIYLLLKNYERNDLHYLVFDFYQ